GHMSEFLLVPDRGFAITILTNGSRGHELGSAVLAWALAELVGVRRPEPKTQPLGAKAAAAYAGRYKGGVADLIVNADGDGLLLTYELDPKVLEAQPDMASALPPPLP